MSVSARIPGEVYFLLLVGLMMFAVWNLMISALQDFVLVLSGDSSALGVSFGIFTLFSVAFRVLTGRILGRVNDGLVLTLGMILLVVPVVMYLLADSLPTVYLGRAIHGAAWALATVSMMTIAVRGAPSARVGEVVGYVNSVNFGTMILFPAIGSTIVAAATLDSFRVLLTMEMLLSLTACPLAFLVWRTTSRQDSYALRSSDQFISRPALIPTLSAFLVCVGFGGILSYSPSIAVLHDVANPGLFIALLAAGQLLGATAGGRLSDRRGYSHLFLVGTAMVVLGLFVAATGDDPVTYVSSSVLFGLGLGLVTITLTALSALFVEAKDKPLAMATFSAGFDGGIMVGSFAIAAMGIVGMGLSLGLLMAALTASLSLVAYGPLKRRETQMRSKAISVV